MDFTLGLAGERAIQVGITGLDLARFTGVKRPDAIRVERGLLNVKADLKLTGGALAVGLFMIVGLLILVVVQGVTTFWPTDLVRFTTTSGDVYMGEGDEVFSRGAHHEGVEAEIGDEINVLVKATNVMLAKD